MPFAIQTFELSKQFPKQADWHSLFFRQDDLPPAVDKVSLEINEGELFGLVGPNGAGKTTFIKMLSTMILPSSGSARVNGFELSQDGEIKRTVGLATSDERSFFWRLSGRQNLEFFAVLDNVPPKEIPKRIESVLEIVGLGAEAEKRFLTYSTGMRQRLSIARALLAQPRLLFLDEPTKGLDPVATRRLHDLIRNELTRQQGITVLMTSHNLGEVEQLCDRVAVLFGGRIKGCGTMAELRKQINLLEEVHLEIQAWSPGMRDSLSNWLPNLEVDSLNGEIGHITLRLPQGRDDLDHINDIIWSHGGKIRELAVKRPSLELIFDQIAQEKAVESPEKERISKKIKPEVQTVVKSSRPGAIREFLRVAWAFLQRDLRAEMSYRVSFLLQFFNVFFSVAVFYFVAKMFGGAVTPFLEPYGGDYFSFVLIGIAFAGYFNVGLSGFSNSLRRAQTTGTLEAMLSTPTRLSTIILSSSQWSYLMTTLRVVVYLLIGTLILGVDLGQGNFGAALLILVLTVISFGSLGIIAAGFIMVLKQGNPVTWVFGTTASLLGGVYYPVDVMPVWMQRLADFLPVTYALRGMRLALLQGASFSTLQSDILALTGFCVFLLPLSLLAFRFAVRRARADGSLTHY